MVTDVDVYQGVECLTAYRDLLVTEEAEVKLNLRQIPAQDWPENTDDHNVVFFGQSGLEGVRGSPRK